MVATLAKAATADYYIHSQASFRPPGDYYLSGEEPDGVWWNPSGHFSGDGSGILHGEVLDSADFYKLYRGIDPLTGDKLVQNAGAETRCPAYDLTFNADKTVSALWAIAPPELRAQIETAHNDAVKVALEDTIQKHCSYTRIREDQRGMKIVPADIMAALFQHGASRANDPHLHTHCVILNIAKAHHDGKWRALHGKPLYAWQKAAGAAYRAELGWLLRDRLGIELETHGDDQEFTKVKNIPQELVAEWSKRDQQIVDTAAKFGVSLNGNGAFHGAVQRATRAPKQHGVEPEIRHENWMGEASAHIEDLEAFMDAATGHEFHFTEELRDELEEKLTALPEEMTKMESVFRYTQLYEKTLNATAGMLSRETRQDLFDQVLGNARFIELDKPSLDYDAGARLVHTRTFTSAHTLKTEKDINELSARLVDTGSYEIPTGVVEKRISELQAEGYPTSDEQTEAMHAATRSGRIAIIEGAAGSGKTTTLRPIADLYRERGYRVIATAVPWEVSLELGTDLDALNRCVDKLIADIAVQRLRLDPRTVIFVDEAGMLSSTQALKILQIARGTGAKVIFAGDTHQQQPVEAGPGLRLIRDVTGSTRVDTIRRQKADVEDILVAVHDEDRETARLRAKIAPERERQKILDEFEAMPDETKASVRPWQVVASEDFRDGKAAAAIAAYDARERLHIGRDLDSTLTRIVDDWDRFRTEQPEKSAAVIAMTNAECRALSHLMRERVLKGNDGPRFTVQACRSRSPRARPEPLEIAVGDVLRAGALMWRKQIFNGTYMTVLELEERGTIPDSPDEPRLWIRARTNHGRIVEFHHDEMRDYHGKIRLNHGYTMTMTSAQGRTVDRAFVLADQKPARETIYPACTRHRERLDIYVNRKPIELDIRQQRNEETAGDPVTDVEVREYLARSWSRMRPKEAAKDYMSAEMKARHFGSGKPSAASDGPAAEAAETLRRTDPKGRTATQWLTANDAGNGKLSDVAAQIRYSEIRVRHGLAAQTLGQACNKLTASLRQWDLDRADKGNAAVAMDPAFRKDLSESTAILRTVTPFIEGNPLNARVLREHGGIDVSDLKAFADAHTRAASIFKLSQPERREIDPSFKPAARPRDPMEEVFANAERLIASLEPEPAIAETRERLPADTGLVQAPTGDLDPDTDAALETQPDMDWEPNYDVDWDPQDIPDYDYPPDREAPEEHSAGIAPPVHDTIEPAPEVSPGLDAGDGFPQHQVIREEPDIGPAIDPSPETEHRPAAETPDRSADRAPEIPASVTPGTPPAPSPAALIDDHALRLQRHCEDADAMDMNPFDAPGWDELENELRGFLALPGLQPADLQYLQDEIGKIDATYEARREAEALCARHFEERDAHAEELFHPYEAATTHRDLLERIHNDGLAIAALPALSDASRLKLLQVCNSSQWLELLEHREAVEAQSPAAIQQRQQQAQTLFDQYIERRDAHIADALDPSTPTSLFSETGDEIHREGRSLLELPDLPETARAQLQQLYGPGQQSDSHQEPEDARQQPTRESSHSAGRADSYATFGNDLKQHVEEVKRLDRHPYETPGWGDLAKRCDHLLQSGTLEPEQQKRLAELSEHHQAWQASRGQERMPFEDNRMPFEQDRGPSSGMSF